MRLEDSEAIHKAVQLYRDWREAMREFQALQIEERELLRVQIQKKAMRMD